MTISQQSIGMLADNIKYIHALGFKYINGVNLAEGDFDWSDAGLVHVLVTQLAELVDFYVENPQLQLDQLMARHIEHCAAPKQDRKKVCGIGHNTTFYDIDGKKYPCSYVTPMTFSKSELDEICLTDFTSTDLFIDEDCFKNCYLYPICSSCAGANYFVNHTFSKRIKTRCTLTKIIALYIAELHTQRILKYRDMYNDETVLYYLIQSIMEIKEKYYDEVKAFVSK